MITRRHCSATQQDRAYMVHRPEPTAAKVIVLSASTETITLQASLVHPITKTVYSQETLELYSPVYLVVQSGNPCWYFIISKDRCSCGQSNCTHVEVSKQLSCAR